MTQIPKRWQIATPISAEADQELQKLTPIMRQILFNRGIATQDEARKFLRALPPEDVDPHQLLDMEKAVTRIHAALQDDEKMVVYGDYDADGVTATTLMMQTLRALGASVQPYIPNRFDEGYGLNNPALDKLQGEGVTLVITVDCGIRALEPAQHAQTLGIDLIITDHHTPGAEIPAAFAVINPKRPGDPYPDKDLAGVGVAYKLASALVEKLEPADFYPKDILDLVAIGTVADLVPMIGENRALVRAGLDSLRRPQRQGIISLMGVASVRPAKVTAMNIGFSLGPRINAAGRLASALTAYEMLISQDVFETARLAQHLDNQNRERQQITREMQALAEEMAHAKDGEPYLYFAASPDFNPGVVGLAASRLVDQFYRPAIVAEQGEAFTRASCRSIPEFHITEALNECASLLTRHGGHAAAAGFTVPNENVPALVERLEGLAAEKLGGQDLRPIIHADAEVPLSALDNSLLKHMDWLEPTGYGNPQPTFVTRNLRVQSSRTVGRDKSHLKLKVSDGHKSFDAIAFRQGRWHKQMPPRIDLVYNFETNEFNGRVTPQLNVRDLKATEG